MKERVCNILHPGVPPDFYVRPTLDKKSGRTHIRTCCRVCRKVRDSANANVPDPPCQSCKFWNDCARGMACIDFRKYADCGPWGSDQDKREPSVGIFRKIFES